jgi:hypothetical protein
MTLSEAAADILRRLAGEWVAITGGTTRTTANRWPPG